MTCVYLSNLQPLGLVVTMELASKHFFWRPHCKHRFRDGFVSPLVEEVAVLPKQKAHLGCSYAVNGIRGYSKYEMICSGPGDASRAVFGDASSVQSLGPR